MATTREQATRHTQCLLGIAMQEGAAGALEALALLPEAARDAVRFVLVAAVGALAGAR